MKRQVLLLVAVILIVEFGQSQTEKRIRRDDLIVRVSATVSSVSQGYLRFGYSFQNDSASHQRMVGVDVELSDEWSEHGGTVRNVVVPTERDWGEFPSVGEKIRWNAQYDTTGLDFLEIPPRSAILPGEKLSFSLDAKGLPGMGYFWVEGWAPWFFTEEERDSLLREGYPESELHATDEKFLRGSTVVRKSAPDPFVPLAFLDTLISYKHQALDLGWIKNRGIANSLDAKLENARAQLARGNTASAKNILQSFLNEMEALNKKGDHLTSEAYALLKFNAEYLLSKV